MSSTPALTCDRLGKRYGSRWALRDCSLEIPAGTVTALVGPKRRRQDHAATARGRPDQAERRRGERARPLAAARRGDAPAPARLRRTGAPLYKGFTVAEMLKLGRKLNPSWMPPTLSSACTRSGCRSTEGRQALGGQQAQVALTLALAKRPELLVLDEPVASLDPLARREFMQTVMEAVAESGITVILSSHIVADLERVCDHLVILSTAEVQLAGPIESIVASHRVLTGARADPSAVARVHEVIRVSHTPRQTTLLVRANGHVYDTCWQQHEVDLEEIVLAYLGYDGTLLAEPLPTRRGWRRDLGRLAPAARRDADRRRRARPARRADDPDRDRDGLPL